MINYNYYEQMLMLLDLPHGPLQTGAGIAIALANFFWLTFEAGRSAHAGAEPS